MNPYTFDKEIPLTLELTSQNKRHFLYSARFSPDNDGKNIVLGQLYLPKEGKKHPLAVLVHGIGERGDRPCRMIARDLVKRGIACFVVFQVFRPTRISESWRPKFPNIDPGEWPGLYRTAVVDIRQIINWAVKDDRIASGQIAVLGISLGGIISAISMAVDQRIKAGVIIVSGGNYESPQWLKRGKEKHTEEQYKQIEQIYLRYLDEVHTKGFENVKAVKSSYLYDPATYGYLLQTRPLLMINAMWDEWFPRRSIIDLWNACNRPPIKWFVGTHATIWLWYPLIRKEITRFLESAFKT
jgi:cephalosporin-C deacetylase-like acetyl esterase